MLLLVLIAFWAAIMVIDIRKLVLRTRTAGLEKDLSQSLLAHLVIGAAGVIAIFCVLFGADLAVWQCLAVACSLALIWVNLRRLAAYAVKGIEATQDAK